MLYIGGGIDYNSGPYVITFPAGVTRVHLSIPINDDTLFEHDESFGLFIIPDILPDRVSPGYPNPATVIIEDDECKLLKCSEFLHRLIPFSHCVHTRDQFCILLIRLHD